MIMRSLLYKVLLPLFLLCAIALAWLWQDVENFLHTPMNLPNNKYLIEVRAGDNLSQLTRRLVKQKIIRSRRYLIWYARLTGKANNIKTGEYELSPHMTPVNLVSMLNEGKVLQYSFTIVEGWTFKQLIGFLKNDPHIQKTVLEQPPAKIMAALGLAGIHPEGHFLPDTYLFPNNTTDVAFLKRAYHDMQMVLAAAWQKRSIGLAVRTPYEALILASIVEKETALPTERTEIAGVFNRRLLQHIRLQTDPTVIYGMGDHFDGNLRRRDLLADTPYNTYRHFGLPPTPIAMPGKDSIEAVLHPDDSDKLFFVSRGDRKSGV